MTRTPHDQLAKQVLEHFLSRFGTVQSEHPIPAEVRWADIYFDPYPELATDPNSIGVLGQLVGQRCLIEPLHNAASNSDVRNCLIKLLTQHAQMEREARRSERALAPQDWPLLWILVPPPPTPSSVPGAFSLSKDPIPASTRAVRDTTPE